ncbi:hypothetical protein T01_5732 [Trichinella spiralis]|uniref:Uncharacterized protein n=1 Tax=Trichinella spiralis TaxID=6334 RepID=A0A0V1B5U4_TRISP|nr:hypothetical protein T01_5732 [Trichinella spiralis]
MSHQYRPLVDSLQHITEWKDSSVASKAEQLRVAVCRGSFVLSLAVLSKVLALALPLSKSFQDSCLEIWEAAEKLYGDLIPLPRNISRQINRSIDPKENGILPIDGVENFFGERYSVVPRQIASTPQ